MTDNHDEWRALNGPCDLPAAPQREGDQRSFMAEYCRRRGWQPTYDGSPSDDYVPDWVI
jgi:hypothetical protein